MHSIRRGFKLKGGNRNNNLFNCSHHPWHTLRSFLTIPKNHYKTIYTALQRVLSCSSPSSPMLQAMTYFALFAIHGPGSNLYNQHGYWLDYNTPFACSDGADVLVNDVMRTLLGCRPNSWPKDYIRGDFTVNHLLKSSDTHPSWMVWVIRWFKLSSNTARGEKHKKLSVLTQHVIKRSITSCAFFAHMNQRSMWKNKLEK